LDYFLNFRWILHLVKHFIEPLLSDPVFEFNIIFKSVDTVLLRNRLDKIRKTAMTISKTTRASFQGFFSAMDVNISLGLKKTP